MKVLVKKTEAVIVALNDYQIAQLEDITARMSRPQLVQTIGAIASAAPEAVADVLGLEPAARYGDEAHKHQDEIIAKTRADLAKRHAGAAEAYDLLDEFTELVSQDLQVAKAGEYAAGFKLILGAVQLFPWLEERTHKVIQRGLVSSWFDSIAAELAPLPSTDDARAALALVDAAIADADFAGIKDYLVAWRQQLTRE
jgi:hypothetical protein